jgi:hypothetical protein
MQTPLYALYAGASLVGDLVVVVMNGTRPLERALRIREWCRAMCDCSVNASRAIPCLLMSC